MKSNIWTITILLFLVVLTGSAFSQKSDSTLVMDDSTKVKIIKDLLIVSGTADYGYVILDNVIKNFENFMTNVPKDYWEKFKNGYDLKPFLEKLIPVYYKRFTLPELNYIMNFFRNPIGKKWASLLTEMNEEIMNQADALGGIISKELNMKLTNDGYINTGK